MKAEGDDNNFDDNVKRTILKSGPETDMGEWNFSLPIIAASSSIKDTQVPERHHSLARFFIPSG